MKQDGHSSINTESEGASDGMGNRGAAVSNFVSTYANPEADVAEYRHRVRTRYLMEDVPKYALLGLVVLAILYAAVGPLPNYPVGQVTTVASFILLLTLIISDWAVGRKMNESNMTKQVLLYHELARASTNLDENPERSLSYLQTVDKLLSREDFPTISERNRNELREYIRTVHQAHQPENALQETYPTVVESVAVWESLAREDRLQDQIASIDTTAETDVTILQRLIADTSELVTVSLFTVWGALACALALGSIIAFYYDQPTIGVAIPSLVSTAYLIYDRRTERTSG